MKKNVTGIEWHELKVGLLILMLALSIPFWLNEQHLHIYRDIRAAVDYKDSAYLLKASIKLVFMNCVRTTPLYLGAFCICEAVPLWCSKKSLNWIKGFLSIPIVTFMEWLTYRLTGIYYVFGFTAIIVVISITLLLQIDLFPANFSGRLLIITLITISLQFLTVNPSMDFFRMGDGEISRDIKNLTRLMGLSRTISLVYELYFVLMVLMTGVVLKLLQDEERLHQIFREKTSMLIEQTDSHIRDVELRTYSELNSIIHDLKTPLAAIQGLSSLTSLITENEKIVEYQDHISQSVDTMSEMITEFLKEDQRNTYTLEDLFTQVSSFLSTNVQLNQRVSIENNCPQSQISCNKMRLVRALVNLIENGYSACLRKGEKTPKVRIYCENINGKVSISVWDNGQGIPEEKLPDIWNPGFSLSGSYGLGLAFVKHVIDNQGGAISVQSSENEYTCFTILLDEVKEND